MFTNFSEKVSTIFVKNFKYFDEKFLKFWWKNFKNFDEKFLKFWWKNFKTILMKFFFNFGEKIPKKFGLNIADWNIFLFKV